MRNRYASLRHGISLANEAGIIVSRFENGRLSKFGLSEKGRSQARSVAEAMATRKPILLASDFSRTRETAEIVAENLGATVYLQPLLRERDFGDFELSTNENYERVWRLDASDSSHRQFGVESVDSVLERCVHAVELAEKAFINEEIVLVSHGDALQILQTWFCRRRASEHRSLPHLETCELRTLSQSSSTI